MYRRFLIYILMAIVLAACSHDGGIASADATVALHIRVAVPDDSSKGSRADYEADKFPAGDGEKMHTVRIIILNGNGNTEHNTLWDLTANPTVLASGEDFPVKANDTKTIILVANEDGATIDDPTTGKPLSAAEYFASISAFAGQHVDVDALLSLEMKKADNLDGDGRSLRTPLLMTAVHTYHVGAQPTGSVTFNIARAAVKYTYRITNRSASETVAIDALHIGGAASAQYVFHNADFTDDTQMFWTAYRTPATTSGELTIDAGISIAPGATVELPAVYIPEGAVLAEGDIYRTSLTIDGLFAGWRPIMWHRPGDEANDTPMTDLPRNTHVIINAAVTKNSLKLNFTVCPWVDSEIDIPPFE